MKTTWERPALIILSRSQPEEAVLTVCKEPPSTGLGPGGIACKGQSGQAPCNTQQSS